MAVFPQTSVETYGSPQQPMEAEADARLRRKELSATLCLLLKVCLSLIHGVHDLQYTAMVTINKVIDTCVVHRLAHFRVKVSEALQHPCNDRYGPSCSSFYLAVHCRHRHCPPSRMVEHLNTNHEPFLPCSCQFVYHSTIRGAIN